MAYTYIYTRQDEALKEAYQAFQQKWASRQTLSANEQKRLTEMNQKLESFCPGQRRMAGAGCVVRGVIHYPSKNDYWPSWPNKLDKRLFYPGKAATPEAIEKRVKEIKTDYAEVLGQYRFIQFIAQTQKECFKAFALKEGLTLLADRQVAFSDRDIWGYQSIFLPDYLLGAPPDVFSDDGQGWGFPGTGSGAVAPARRGIGAGRPDAEGLV